MKPMGTMDCPHGATPMEMDMTATALFSPCPLRDVISALSTGGQHIPYRNHKLTMLMSDSLGGNAKTLMFGNVPPLESNLDETYNLLMVRLIVNDPSKNVSSKEVARLNKLVAYWEEQAGRRGDEEDLEEIQEKRPAARESSDDRHLK